MSERHYSPLGAFWRYPIERYIWDGLRQEWPQLNDRSKISRTDYYEIQLADIDPLSSSVIEETIRVKKSGWNELQKMLFYEGGKYIWTGETDETRQLVYMDTLQVLDDPAERSKYVNRLWNAMIKSPVPAFWRIMGKLTGNKQTYNRGTELVISPILPQVQYRTLHLKQFGCDIMGEQYYGAFAYDAQTDTLFVRKFR